MSPYVVPAWPIRTAGQKNEKEIVSNI